MILGLTQYGEKTLQSDKALIENLIGLTEW